MATAMGIHWVSRIQVLIAAALILAATACSREHSNRPQADSSAQTGAQETPLQPSEYGGERGNGAEDHLWTDGLAWFADESKTIQYCIEYDASFGVTEERVSAATKAALNRWHSYLTKKQVPGSPFPLAVHSSRLAKCDGSEDLTFYFGKKTAGIEQVLRFHPLLWGYGGLLSYDKGRRWGKGYIWLRNIHSLQSGELKFPNWEHDYALNAILTHEVGHIHGMNHIDGTVMQKEIVGRIRGWRNKAPEIQAKLVEIDQATELIIGTQPTNYEGELGGQAKFNRESGDSEIAALTSRNFKRLTGRSPRLPVRAHVAAGEDSLEKLVVADARGTYEFPLTRVEDSWSSDPEADLIFKVLLEEGTSRVAKMLRTTEMLTLTTSSGEVLSISASRNMDTSDFDLILKKDRLRSIRLTLTVIENNVAYPLFITTY